MKSYVLAPTLLALAAVVGCNGAVESSGDPAAAVVPANATTVAFNVPDMDCEFACGPKVREALEEIDGVYKDKIDIDIGNRVATVVADPDKFDVDTALAKLEAIKFPATVKE